MILKQCYLTANRCYSESPKITNNQPMGIVMHSTGVNNKTLKRYVQPLTTDDNYDEVIADIGKNKNNNSWNRNNVSKCVHAMIGVNAAGVVETYETLPYDTCAWGVANGAKGSYNYNPTAHIQFEILEDNCENEDYFNRAFTEAIEYCAYLCQKFGFTPDQICSHKEAYDAGYASNHGDPDHWLKKFGKNMDWFRDEVRALLEMKPPVEDSVVEDEDPVEADVEIQVPVVSESVNNGAETDESKGKLHRLLVWICLIIKKFFRLGK